MWYTGEGNGTPPVFLSGKPHGWRSLAGYSPWGRRELNTTEWLHFSFTFTLRVCLSMHRAHFKLSVTIWLVASEPNGARFRAQAAAKWTRGLSDHSYTPQFCCFIHVAPESDPLQVFPWELIFLCIYVWLCFGAGAKERQREETVTTWARGQGWRKS